MPRRRNRRNKYQRAVAANDGQWCKSVGGDPSSDHVKNTQNCEKSDKEFEEKCENDEIEAASDVRSHESDPESASLQRESNADDDDENRTTTRTNIISCKINTNSSSLWQSAENTLTSSPQHTTYTAQPLRVDRDECGNVRNLVKLPGDVNSVQQDGMMGQQQSTKKSAKSHRRSPNREPPSPAPAEFDDPHSEEFYEANCDSYKCNINGDQVATLSPSQTLSDNDSGCEFSEKLREDNVDDETEEFVETTFNFNPIYSSSLVCTRDGVKSSDPDCVHKSAFDDGRAQPNAKYDMMTNGDTPRLPDIVGNTQSNLTEKRGLVSQEAHFSTQLDAAEKEVTYAQSKITELQLRIDDLERQIANKTWAIERLQAELVSAQKEDECVRRKLRLQEAEIGVLKQNASDREDELTRRFTELEVSRNELEIKLKDIQHFTSSLQVQLAEAQSHAETCKKERNKLVDERVGEQKLVQDVLESALNQRDQLEAKFEQLRNVNQEREEHLMEDCEWKMRAMQKKCKDRLDAITKEHQQAMETNAKLKATAEQYLKDLNRLKTIECEAKSLRGLTSEQRDSLLSVSVQLNEVKSELEAAKIRADQEIRNAQRIRAKCESDMIDERRACHLKLEETRMQISIQWENKLMQEMMRLKYELESIYAEERKEALEKVKKEFEKELGDLVQKHNSVENALRQEIAGLEESLKERVQELRDISAKCDKQAVDARIYVDRSDRSNQMILDREIQYREEVVAALEEEREEERRDMERQFSERLQSVSDEFAQELYNNTEELEMKHKKALEVQREKLSAEKDEALQTLESKYKQKISCLETKMKFEEMRMRYERRDPRQEDVRQIAELKEKCEQQERDLHRLTEILREMQITQFPTDASTAQTPAAPPRKTGRNAARKNRNSELKNKMTNCDVIYEEEQENESVDTANGVTDDHEVENGATEA
ncbi:hypothetical protein DMENIID0001_110480 [Sergentomyia squamirostris]